MTKTFCDKCGVDGPVSGLANPGRAIFVEDNIGYTSLELCDSCRKEFGEVVRLWLKKKVSE